MPAPFAAVGPAPFRMIQAYREVAVALAGRSPACQFVLLLMIVLVLSWVAEGSAGWLPKLRLTNAADISYLSENNARCLLADQAGTVHLVWYDFRDGDSEIYYRQFDGAAWGDEAALTSNTTQSLDPAIAIDASGDLNVVWVDYVSLHAEIYHKSFDGVSWTSAVAVTDGSVTCENPSIAADGLGRLHVVWREYRDGSWGIFYSMFDGLTWSERLRITDPAAYPRRASVTCDDSLHVHIAWDDFRDLNWEIYYRRFDGTAWGTGVRLTTDADLSENPTVVTDSLGNIHVFWDDDRSGQFDIYQKTFDGLTWSADQKIVDALSGAFAPSAVATGDSTLHLVWYDAPENRTEIYYMEFDGMSWGTAERLTDVERASENPMVAVDPAGLTHVVWHDNPGGNFEIFWKARGDLPRPELTSIEPDSGHAHTRVSITDLAGANFMGKVAVWLQKDGQEDVQAENEIIMSSSRITCDLDMTGTALGLWDVVVRNIDLQRDTLFAGFRVIPLPPVEVASIDPDIAIAYEGVHIAEVSGGGFAVGAIVRLEKAGEESIDADNVSVESVSRISCDFSLTAAQAGAWDVVVKNPDGQSATLPAAFTVLQSRWDADVRLTYDDAESRLPRPNARAIAVDSQGNIHVVWSDLRDGNREIYYKSFDGASWSADQRLTFADNGSANPAIAIDSYDNIHVVWDDYRDNDYEIYYKSFDGMSWGADERVTNAPGNSRYPSVDTDTADNVHLAWQDKRPGDTAQYAYFRMRAGPTWLDEHIVDADAPDSGTPAVAVDGNNHAHIVWYRVFEDTVRLLHREFDGDTWDDTYIITSSRSVWGPTVAIDHLNQVHVAWHNDPFFYGNYEIFYKRYDGVDWGLVEMVTAAPGISANASIAVDDSGHVHLAWRDERDGEVQIYYSRKEGETWVVQTRLTRSPGESRHPSLALAPDGSLHMVWRDSRDGNQEIYYKKRASGVLAAVEDRLPDTGLPEHLRVFPNPVYTSAQIQFNLGLKTEPVLSIYDVRGRLMRKIEPGVMEQGPQQLSWDGAASSGNRVAPGIYLVEVSTARQKASTKVIVLR